MKLTCLNVNCPERTGGECTAGMDAPEIAELLYMISPVISLTEFRSYIDQIVTKARNDELTLTAVALTSIIPDSFTYKKFLSYAEDRKKMIEGETSE